MLSHSVHEATQLVSNSFESGFIPKDLMEMQKPDPYMGSRDFHIWIKINVLVGKKHPLESMKYGPDIKI